MKKLSKLFAAASAAAMLLCAVPVFTSAADIDYPKNARDFEEFLAKHPDGYIINDDGSIYLYPIDIEHSVFSTGYLVSSSLSYQTEDLDIGMTIRPETKEKGRYLVSLYSSFESIIQFKIPENSSGNTECHFHCFYPCLESYLIDTTDGVKVEYLGNANMCPEEEIEAYVKKCEEEAEKDPDKYNACFSKDFISLDDLTNGIYISYVNSKLSDDGNASPFVMSQYEYNASQKLVIGTPSAETRFEILPSVDPPVIYEGKTGASDDLMTRTGEDRYYRIYDLPERDSQRPLNITIDLSYNAYDFCPAENGWSEYVRFSPPLPYMPTEAPTEVSVPAVQNDVNGDGSFNVADLVSLNKYLLSGGTKITAAADINGDNSVDSFDLVFLRKKLINTDAEEKRYSYIKDVTKYGTDKGIKSAIMGESYVITDYNELTTTLRSLLREAVCRDLEKRYDPGFFKNNVLLLRLTNNSGGLDPQMVDSVDFNIADDRDGNNITVNMKADPTETAKEYIEIHQVSISRNMTGINNGNPEFIWKDAGKKNIGCDVCEIMYSYPKNEQEDKLITSYDEFLSYLSDENFELNYDKSSYRSFMDYFADDIKDRCGIEFNEALFDTKSVYAHLTSNFNEDDFCRAEISGDKLTIHEKHIPDYGDIAYMMIKFYVFDKNDISGVDTIEIRSHRLLDQRYDPGENKSGNWYLAVCQYDFNDESSLALYSRYSLGFAPASGYKLVDEFELTPGFKPFGEDIENLLKSENDISGENFSIKYGEESAEVRFRTSPGGEFTTVEIPYTYNQYFI